MRTTVRLDDGLLTEAKRVARTRGETLTALIERGLRAEITRPRPAPRRRHVKLTTCTARGGLLPGIDLDDMKSVYDRLDGIDDPR
jgi:Bacterial antitoxin of type II TA system, VapB